MNLVKLLTENVPRIEDYRLRDRREFYASSNDKCRRDEYWSFIGEPETNEPDFTASKSFLLGEAIENAFREKWLANLTKQGVYLVGKQVPVGGSKPPWNGYIDFLLEYRTPDSSELCVVEFKTITKVGADMLFSNPASLDKDGYVGQLGLYLKDFYDKGHPNVKGSLFFMGFSANCWMDMLQYNVRYEPETEEAVVYEYIDSKGSPHKMTKRVSIRAILDKWNDIIQHVKEKKVPKPDYVYKYPVTEEMCKNLSDYMLQKVLKGEKIIGDWQVTYSRYRDKIFEVDGITREYTPEETAIFRAEYRRRHPKSKM